MPFYICLKFKVKNKYGILYRFIFNSIKSAIVMFLILILKIIIQIIRFKVLMWKAQNEIVNFYLKKKKERENCFRREK